MEWGAKQRVMRAVRGMSQEELALISGLGGWDLSKIETGKLLPTPESERAIKLALGWPKDELAEVAFGILGGEIKDTAGLRGAMWPVADFIEAAGRGARPCAPTEA